MTKEQMDELLRLVGETTIALQDIAAAMEKQAETNQATAAALQDLVAAMEKRGA